MATYYSEPPTTNTEALLRKRFPRFKDLYRFRDIDTLTEQEMERLFRGENIETVLGPYDASVEPLIAKDPKSFFPDIPTPDYAEKNLDKEI